MPDKSHDQIARVLAPELDGQVKPAKKRKGAGAEDRGEDRERKIARKLDFSQ